MSKDSILLEYDASLEIFKNISQSVMSLINTLLASENIVAHTVSCRVKDRDSLVKKIDKKDKYTKLLEITDVVGIRIITHYSDDVDRIATLLENEFLIDIENSIDKRKMLDPDRFGYLSLHYVASFNKERLKLMEYKSFENLKFEIQIRSILQHTWAEIEHDIGYKSKSEIPKEVRRQFSRLAGLLEIADNEFVNIKDSLENYEKFVSETIVSSPEKINIDAISLYKYIVTDENIRILDNEVAKILNTDLDEISQERAAKLVKNIEYFDISNILELSKLVSAHHDDILQVASLTLPRVGYSPSKNVMKGISLRLFSYVLAAKTLSSQEYDDYVETFRLPPTFMKFLGILEKSLNNKK